MGTIPRQERLLNLLAALLAARAPLPFAEIRGQVSGYDDPASEDALEKRFDRDKAALRQLGIPLEFVAEDGYGRSGYRIERERFFLEEVRFTTEEGIVLAALQRALGPGHALHDGLSSALVKIGVDSPLGEAFREMVGGQQILDPRIPEEESEQLSTLAEAVATLRPATFRYYSLNTGRTRERKVEPYGVGYHRGHWYLVGRDVRARAKRVFRTSRIQGRVKLGRAGGYRVPRGFRLADHIEKRAWELPGGESVEVHVRFAPEIAWMIAENVRPGQRFETRDDGSGVLVLEATDPGKVAAWVAHHGPGAELREPRELRAHLADWLRRTRERYSA